VFQRSWYHERHHYQLLLVLEVVEGKQKIARRYGYGQTFPLTFIPAIDLCWRRHAVEVNANETNGAAEELLAAEGANGGDTWCSVVQDVIAATQAQYMS